MICNQCGIDVPDGEAFCPVCGTPLNNNNNNPEKKPNPTGPKLKQKNPLGIAVVALLAVIAVIGIIMLIQQSGKSKASPPEPVATTSIQETSSSDLPETDTESEVEEAVSWENTYIEYLALMTTRDELKAFSICDLDEDEIPELLIWHSENSELELLTWYTDNVEVCFLGEECISTDDETGITWDERSHVIFSKVKAKDGKTKKQYVKLTDGALEKVTDKDRQALNHPVNYLLANAFEPTEKIISKVINAWNPDEDVCGSTPKEKKKEKKSTETTTPEEETPKNDPPQEAAAPAEPAPQENAANNNQGAIILHPYNPINVRALSDHNSGFVCEINDVYTNLYFYNEVGQGYGSDGQLHSWYKIYLDNGLEGWVRSDLVY